MAWPNPKLTRWAGGPERPIVEDGLVLPVHEVVKLVGSARVYQGKTTWFRGEHVRGSISTLVEKGPGGGNLTLRFRHRGQDVRQVVRLVVTPCRFGGVRWFAVCPRLGLRTAKLYAPAGEPLFLSRRAYGMGYRTQCEDAADRAATRRWKIADRLGPRGGEFPPRPKGMWHRTYERCFAELLEADERMWAEAELRFGPLL